MSKLLWRILSWNVFFWTRRQNFQRPRSPQPSTSSSAPQRNEQLESDITSDEQQQLESDSDEDERRTPAARKV